MPKHGRICWVGNNKYELEQKRYWRIITCYNPCTRMFYDQINGARCSSYAEPLTNEEIKELFFTKEEKSEK